MAPNMKCGEADAGSAEMRGSEEIFSERTRWHVGILLVTAAAASEPIIGRAGAIDGDTLEIHGTRIRLWGIDAPASSQLCRGEKKRADDEHRDADHRPPFDLRVIRCAHFC